ncbi:MAG TPA: hypothetical protein VJP86_06300 [Vicinamibacterales bacterium]|nr:hypothetical protein [Vicinamibacterales bacterium]
MSDLLVWIETSALATWTRESTSIWAYPTILTLHTVGLGIVVGASAVVDLRLLGFAPRIPVPSLRPLFRLLWWAFALNALTGVLLFMTDASHKAVQRVFHIKLGLIAIGLATAWLIQNAVTRSPDGPNIDTGARERGLAVLSLIVWTAAIVAGRLMAYL